jgi:hypothetical protein
MRGSSTMLGVPITFITIRGDPFTELCRIAGEITPTSLSWKRLPARATGWSVRWRCGW